VAHEFSEIGLSSLNQEMEVIRHQDVRIQGDLIGLSRRLEQREELMSVLLIDEDALSFIAPAGDVVDSAGKLHSQRSRHGTIKPET
jgi:hypothetical protein